ncbi:MAG: SDR family oxidoreductase [Clostridiales bacterium]|jgi:NAD(P)-dependent dehydrogenase (short-subunit alcohol dehydrogenase family)|nr:SDR family oxidoreductase [Clostridiales bacterium]
MRYDKLLEGRNVWITGGTAPPYDAYAQLFARHGARLVVMDADAARGARLLESLNGVGADHAFLAGDPADPDGIAAVCEETLERFGAPDVWLYAADLYEAAYIDEMRAEALDQMLAVSVLTPFQIMKVLARPMRENGGGAVVFAGSQYGIQGMNRVSGYGAAKGGQFAMSNAFALEYAADGIRVNAIALGASLPPIGDDLLRQSGEADGPDFWGTVQPFPRRGELLEAANAALFLASDMAGYITGETLYVNGAEQLIAHNHHFPRKDRVLP